MAGQEPRLGHAGSATPSLSHVLLLPLSGLQDCSPKTGEEAPSLSFCWRMASMVGTQRVALLTFAQKPLCLQNVSVGVLGREGGSLDTCVDPCVPAPTPSSLLPSTWPSVQKLPAAQVDTSIPRGEVSRALGQHLGCSQEHKSQVHTVGGAAHGPPDPRQDTST